MPNRIIKESIKTSREIDSLTFFGEVLFYRLMTSCDDYGRYEGEPVIVKNTLFPLKSDSDLPLKDVISALKRLEEVGLIETYYVNNRPYLQVKTWGKHQRIRETRGKYPNPEECADGADSTPQVAADCGGLRPESESESESINISDSKESDCQKPQADFRRAIELWNGLADLGIKPVSRVDPGAKRFDNLRSRLRQYGMAEYENAINRIRGSDFLQGKHGGRPWQITFDWFVKPSNFPKVLEGNYDNATRIYGDILDSIS